MRDDGKLSIRRAAVSKGAAGRESEPYTRLMQKIILVDADARSRLLQGDPDSSRLESAGAAMRALPVLLSEGWTIVTVAASAGGAYLTVLQK